MSVPFGLDFFISSSACHTNHIRFTGYLFNIKTPTQKLHPCLLDKEGQIFGRWLMLRVRPSCRHSMLPPYPISMELSANDMVFRKFCHHQWCVLFMFVTELPGVLTTNLHRKCLSSYFILLTEIFIKYYLFTYIHHFNTTSSFRQKYEKQEKFNQQYLKKQKTHLFH